MYEALKRECLERNLGTYSYIASSGVSAGMAGVISNTADVLKTRMQVQGQSFGTVTRELWKQKGPLMVFVGLGSRILWIIPSVTASMTIFEVLRS